MPDASQTVSLPLLVSILRRHRLVVGLTVLLAVGASLAISATREARYSATAVVAFNDESADLQALGTPAAPSFQPDKEAAAQAERITRQDVINRVRRDIGVRLSTAELQDSISTEVGASTNLVSIQAEASSARLAADIANGFAKAVRDDTTQRSRARYRATARAAQRRAARLQGDRNLARRGVFEDQASRLLALATFAQPVDIVRSAAVPSAPSSPRPVRDAVLAGLLGLMLGIGIAFLRNTFDRRLRTPADVEDCVDTPVVGYVRTALLGSTPLSTNGGPPAGEEEVEPFRILRTNVTFLAVDGGVRLILVTSPLPEEGKSTVAAGLAWAESMTGRRTLLVECDMRRPTLAERFGVEPAPGLSDFLLGQAEPAEILRSVPTTDAAGSEAAPLVLIPAGRPVANHAELLDSDRFRTFLRDVAAVYDRVIVDTPPLLPVSDTLALLPQVEGMLLCLRLGQTTRDEALAARAALEHFPAKPSGVVLTGADESQTAYYVGEYAYPSTPSHEGG